MKLFSLGTLNLHPVIGLWLVCVVLYCPGSLWAQPGRGGGGFPGGRGGPGGGFPGGAGPGGGFPGRGGPGGPRGGFDPREMLGRLDRNQNGTIDKEEMEGPAGFMVKRMGERLGLDLSKPIPLSKIYERLPGGSSDRNRDSKSSNEKKDPEDDGLVPGFGMEETLPVVPGFGEDAEFFAIRVLDEDTREAERWFRYYDRDRNGTIDQAEMSRSRSGDLPQYDRDGDGKLTLTELAYRAARRRVEGDDDKNSSRSSSRSGSDGESRSRYGRGGFGFGGSGGSSRSSSSGKSSGSKSSSSKSSQPLTGPSVTRWTTTDEHLEKAGVSDWFMEADKDRDGQVAMSEYSDQWNQDTLAKFFQIDTNQDGLITPQEFMLAGSGASVGNARVAVTDSSSQTSKASSTTSNSSKTPTSSSSGRSVATSGKPINPRYLSYAAGRIKQYDENGDGVLVSSEWSKMKNSPAAADANRNGKITAEELARYLSR